MVMRIQQYEIAVCSDTSLRFLRQFCVRLSTDTEAQKIGGCVLQTCGVHSSRRVYHTWRGRCKERSLFAPAILSFHWPALESRTVQYGSGEGEDGPIHRKKDNSKSRDDVASVVWGERTRKNGRRTPNACYVMGAQCER